MNDAIGLGILLTTVGFFLVLLNRVFGGLAVIFAGEKWARRSGVSKSPRSGDYPLYIGMGAVVFLIGIACTAYGVIAG